MGNIQVLGGAGLLIGVQVGIYQFQNRGLIQIDVGRLPLSGKGGKVNVLRTDLYRGLAEQEALIPLSEILDEVPEGAEEFGIRLGDTEFYRSNSKLKFIPPNTMLCVRKTSTLDVKSSEKKEKQTEAHKSLLRDIVEYTAPEEE